MMALQRALFLINTPYQLMVAINLAESNYKEWKRDLIISDRLTGASELAQRVKNENIFETVYTMELSKICPQQDKKCAIRNTIRNPIKELNRVYTAFLFANLNYDVTCIYRKLKHGNRKIELHMFEDGFASYSKYYEEYLEKFRARSGNGCKRLFHYITNQAFRNIKGIFVFEPEIMTYQPEFPVIKMQNIDVSNKALLSVYNRVFNYSAAVDHYDKKVIFFEESYYADGFEVNDIAVVEKLADIVGKENIFVKIHPRNPQNRFAELGYATNKNTAIPWEVIAMNLDLSDKILVTIASVAAIVPATMLGKKYTGILLMDLIEDDSFLKKNITNLYKKVCDGQENLHVVNSVEELSACFKMK